MDGSLIETRRGYRADTYDAVVLLFGLTMGISAALLFAIQPMYAKMLLPLVGGAPAVWNVVVLFFQTALLAGYVCAHLIRTYLPLRLQPCVHIGLALAALLMLPFHAPAGSVAAVAHPVAFVLGKLFIGAALPFLVISATSPLVQSWFSRIEHRQSSDPYFFYAASNFGSLLGLALYPFVLEPFFGLKYQTHMWLVVYAMFVVLLGSCAFVTWKFGKSALLNRDVQDEAVVPKSAISGSARARWVLLAFIPASLSLATTTQITSQVAPIPLLWTLPLAVYLLTFIIAFSRRPFVRPEIVGRLLPYTILIVVFLALLSGALPGRIDILISLLNLFAIGIVCHGELAASRPDPKHLTTFYILLSLGGALGGLFNALIAPVIFTTVAEYPVTLVLACAALPAFGHIAGRSTEKFWDAAWPLALGVLVVGAFEATKHLPNEALVMQIVEGLAIVAIFAFLGRRLRFAAGLAVLFIITSFLPSRLGYRPDNANTLFQVLNTSRNFFGTKLVVDNGIGWHELVHGATVHGLQNTAPSQARTPLSYYSVDGPLAAVLGAVGTQNTGLKQIGVVGLGVAATACYRRPGQQWTFVEIDPQVVDIARRTSLFSYLSTCAPKAAVIVGDGRIVLENMPSRTFDLLVLDAYSSDQPPVHMLTREAFTAYARRVKPHGMIAIHISNRYFNLAPVVANIAAAIGWEAWLDNDLALDGRRVARGEFASQWVVMSRSAADVRRIAANRTWQQLKPDPRIRIWTDDYSSLLLIAHL